MKKNYGVGAKSRLGFCGKKMWFVYRNMMKNYGVEMKNRFDFHEEKLWG